MAYYLGGYYLSKIRPLGFGTRREGVVYTASDCINDNLINPWAYSWTKGINNETKEAKELFGLTDDSVLGIRKWVDLRHSEKKIGWINVFLDVETAQEYKHSFFSQTENVNLFALYFEESEAKDIIREFKPQSENDGEIGLHQMLSKKVFESDQSTESLVGYDLIGIEVGGDFHTFHCHDIGSELSERYGLTLNEYGLFNAHDDWKPILDYLNDDASGCEPVPWYVAKTKLLKSN